MVVQQVKNQNELLVGGKVSKAGVFEDDDDEIPIVKEIQYIESPIKEKKKDKKEKKKEQEKLEK